jgi:hypothetical protein
LLSIELDEGWRAATFTRSFALHRFDWRGDGRLVAIIIGIYFHKTGIPGGVTLFEGDRVAFDTEISSRSGKIQAVNLRLV